MDAQPIKLKLSGRLTGLKESTSPAAQPPQPPPAVVAVPAKPLLDVQALHNDLAELTCRAREAHAQEKALAADAAQLSVELGVAIADRLLQVEIAADRQRLDRIVTSVLEKMPATRSVIVRGHSRDLTLLQSQLSSHADWASHRELLQFRPDQACERGRFRIEADEWFVEWDTQRSLAELRAALLEETFFEQ